MTWEQIGAAAFAAVLLYYVIEGIANVCKRTLLALEKKGREARLAEEAAARPALGAPQLLGSEDDEVRIKVSINPPPGIGDEGDFDRRSPCPYSIWIDTSHSPAIFYRPEVRPGQDHWLWTITNDVTDRWTIMRGDTVIRVGGTGLDGLGEAIRNSARDPAGTEAYIEKLQDDELEEFVALFPEYAEPDQQVDSPATVQANRVQRFHSVVSQVRRKIDV